MSETTKLLQISTGTGAPGDVQVNLLDFRDAVLKNPNLIVDALRSIIERSTTAGGTIPMSGDLPLDTPVFKMVPGDSVSLLTDNAKKLTKADLLAFSGATSPRKTAEQLNLTVQDIKSLELAFHMHFNEAAASPAGLKSDISCCCCSPCCCCTAAAVIQPKRIVA